MNTTNNNNKQAINCGGCNGAGIWCRGCGNQDKEQQLIKKGYDEREIKYIMSLAYGSCDDDKIPCYICKPLKFLERFKIDGIPDLTTTTKYTETIIKNYIIEFFEQNKDKYKDGSIRIIYNDVINFIKENYKGSTLKFIKNDLFYLTIYKKIYLHVYGCC